MVYMRMPALPPQLAQPAAFMGKRLRCMDWQRAALGASMASVAMLSFLLYSSYTTNRYKLRVGIAFQAHMGSLTNRLRDVKVVPLASVAVLSSLLYSC